MRWSPRYRLLWVPLAVALAGLIAMSATRSTRRTTVASVDRAVSSSTYSAGATGATSVPATTEPTTTPSDSTSTGPAASSPQKTLCPCDPVTGEPLGGAAIDKGVDGVVTNPVGAPLEGICVTVDKPAGSMAVTTVTGPDGSYRIDLGKTGGPPLNQLDVASCDGSFDPWPPTTRQPPDVNPNAFNHINLTLHAAADLAGTAVDQTGKPYDGGCVAVYAAERRVDAPIDQSGHFDARGLPAGELPAEIVFPCGGPAPPTTDGSPSPTFTLREGETTYAHLSAQRAQ